MDPSLIDHSDDAFDAFWEEEARNPNRNRIRIGRQYQAQVAPILKSGEGDGRRLEDLEKLSWNPHNPLSRLQLDQYFSVAKAIGLFVQAVDTCHEGLEDEEDDVSEQEEKPFEILQIGGPNTSSEDANSIFSTSHSSASKSEKQSITTRQQRLQQQKEQQSSVDSEPGSSSPLKHTANTRIQNALKGLSAFITSHHSPLKEKRCKAGALAGSVSPENPAINLGSSEQYNLKTLSELLMGEWTANEAQIFATALKECGKNFSAIKKDYLPWKSVRSIIEFYYLSVDKENEGQNKKKSPNKHLDKQSKSPLDESKRKRTSRDTNSDGSGNGNGNGANGESNSEAPDDETSGSNGTNGDDNGASSLASDSQAANSSKACSNTGVYSKESEHKPIASDGSCLVKGFSSGTSRANGFLHSGLAPSLEKSAINGNINGNHVLLGGGGNPKRSNSTPSQELLSLKAKPISQNLNIFPDGSSGLAGNSMLGSLNLYLHGELVLKLNAQQRESGQKWVESLEAMQSGSKKKRSSLLGPSNGCSGRVPSSLKRTIDAKVTQLFKEDGDDVSTCGGDMSASDDDSMTSTESSSLVASSPSSSSTIHSAAKKARVKVENLSSVSSNGNSISPPNTARKEVAASSGNNNSKRTMSPSIIDSEMELKKKILEANLPGFFANGLPLLFNNAAVAAVAGGFFEPPKAHSNSPNVPSPQFPPLFPLHVSSASPVKSATPKVAPAETAPTVNGHGPVNGFVPGPVDLTRKSANGHSTGELLSTSRSRNSHLSSSASPAIPKAAHQASSSSSALSPGRLSASFPGLFSLPAPPPPNVPVSPNGHGKHLKKSNLIRSGGVQFAK